MRDNGSGTVGSLGLTALVRPPRWNLVLLPHEGQLKWNCACGIPGTDSAGETTEAPALRLCFQKQSLLYCPKTAQPLFSDHLSQIFKMVFESKRTVSLCWTELKSTVLEGKSQVLHSHWSLDLIIILTYSFHILILIITKWWNANKHAQQ